MAPTRTASRFTISAANNVKRSMTTRSNLPSLKIGKETRSKRKADSPPAKEKALKRSALGDVTNRSERAPENKPKGTKTLITGKKVTVHQKLLPSVKTALRVKTHDCFGAPPAPAARVQTRANARTKVPNETVQKPKEAVKENVCAAAKVKRLSNEFEKSEESLYSTALEEMLVYRMAQ